MDTQRKPEQQAIVPFTNQRSRLLPERRKPLLRDRFRVEVAPGIDDPESLSARSRALAVWMLERWREGRKAEPTSEGILQSRKQHFETSHDEQN